MYMNAYAYQYMRIHFVHACALLMSPGTTCDLGKGKVSVLMWQLMPFPLLQMVSIGHGAAQGQLLGVTAVRGVEKAKEHLRCYLLYVCVCTLCANKCKLSPYRLPLFLILALCAPMYSDTQCKGQSAVIQEHGQFQNNVSLGLYLESEGKDKAIVEK